jgi:hypothetical protein
MNEAIRFHNNALKGRIVAEFLEAENLEDAKQFAELLSILLINTGAEIGFTVYMTAKTDEEKTNMIKDFLNKIGEVVFDTIFRLEIQKNKFTNAA